MISSLYQIYLRSFCDSNGDGVGDLPGLIEKLPYVKKLGVDAIWVSPFFPSGGADSGYDVTDYTGVDPVYGTLEDVDRLIAAAQVQGLKVIFDLVLGHTSHMHPWFKTQKDFYVWADKPNNWLSVFGGPAWTYDEERGQYYLHHFLAEQPTLNLRNPEVEQALFDVARFWLERGVDGFRLDAVDFYFHDALLRDNPLNPNPSDKPFAAQLHTYDMMQPETRGFIERFRVLLQEFGEEKIAFAEISSQPGSFTRVGAYTAPRMLHAAYTLRLARGGISAKILKEAWLEMQAAAPDGVFCWNFSNHDVVRAMTRFSTGNAAHDLRLAKLIGWLRQILPGIDCVYQGEELGLPQAVIAPEDQRDTAVRLGYPGRDGARTPMPWNGKQPQAGFTSASKPWLPIPDSHLPLAVAAQENDAASLLNTYRRAFTWRRQNEIVRAGAVRFLDLPEPLLGIVRLYQGEEFCCLFNISATEKTVAPDSLPAPFGLKEVLSLPPYTMAYRGPKSSFLPCE